MTVMTGFILAAALLALIVLAILLPPLLRTPKTANTVDRQEANLEIFRDQLSELEHDRHQGTLAEADFAQARSELQRRLLEESQPDAAVRRGSGGRKTALALLVLIPLAAAAGYALLGRPQAFDPMQTQARISPQQIEELLGTLVEKLKANPDDAKGWVMLARSYKALGRYAESAEAFSHGGALVDAEPALLADYAEVLGQVHGGTLEGKPRQLLERALELDPDEPQALFLAGAAASERRDFSAVADYWGRLLRHVEPNSEDGRSLAAAVAKAREMITQTGGKADTKAAPKSPDAGTVRPETISGEVTLDDKLAAQTQPDDVLFIFARPDAGSRMPLAVMRARVADLPLTFRLDDSMALPGGSPISAFEKVSVEARIAKAGKAQSSSGDLFGSRQGIKPGSKNLQVTIDQVQP